MTNEWYYQVMGEIRGPVSAPELKKRSGTNEISEDTLIKKGEDGTWVPARTVKGLFTVVDVGGNGNRSEMPMAAEVGKPSDAASTPPSRSPAPHVLQANRSPAGARIAVAVTFVLLGAGTALGSLLFLLDFNHADSAPKQAAVGAFFATLFVAAYVIARCIEKVAAALSKVG